MATKIIRGPKGLGLQAGDKYAALSIVTENVEVKISNSLVRTLCATCLLAGGVGGSAVPALAHAIDWAHTLDWTLRLTSLQ
jgi:hypothetical protein